MNIINVAEKSRTYDPCRSRPYNRYTIYYILERELFLQTKFDVKSKTGQCPTNFISGYENLVLPALPPRFRDVDLPHDWYMPGKRKVAKRNHKKSHGVASFQKLARVVADGWKSIDDVTLGYCTSVAKILKQRHTELKKIRDLARSGTADGGSSCAASELSSENNVHKLETLPKPQLRQSTSCTSLTVLVDFVIPPPNADDALTHGQSQWSGMFDDDDTRNFCPSPAHMIPAETTVHAQVDIPDQDIMAMWRS